MNESGPEFWSDVAAGYDRWYRSPMGQAFDRAEKRAAARLLPGDGRGRALVEVGSGTGHWSAWLAERGWRVTGVDPAEGMVEVARARGVEGVRFVKGDALRLPFADDAFDAAMTVTALEFLGDGPDGDGRAERAVAEMVRVTRPGGPVLVGVLNRLAPVNRRRTAEAEPPWGAARLFSPEELERLLAAHGEPAIRICAFVPEAPAALAWWRLREWAGRLVGRRTGAMVFGRLEAPVGGAG